ncbi:molybdopterin synthase catalytic subunit isoform X2 [Belonocnema kinseyi]|uniref:molybdopterin synthase catalytic subunit isoform X2 n=1 Tax=Belonocnema kinseyi TaxID=2817044 RepID=UPI00143CCEDF|nr:molybdopterin synthase catalytic subunit isoform X2 [Belonocnema kinseyi]
MDKPKDIVQLQHARLNINDIVDLVTSPKSGAISTFIGTTRDNFGSKSVLKLEYEAYEPMALKEMKNLCAKVRSQWEVDRIAIFHRLGEVPVSEVSVVIAISSAHRKESLEAVNNAIDMLKASVPIWKKEIYAKEEPQWKENKECSWSSCGSLRSEENRFQEKVKIEVPSEDEDDNFSDGKSHVIIDPSIVQVRADSEELNRRIQAFISRKREQVNLVNVQEFCFHGSGADETIESCARVDAILTRHKDSKSHMKVHRVLNPWGPQTTVPSTLEKTKTTDQSCNYPPALEERLSSSEKLLGINKPVPRDIYERLKIIEDRVLQLESLSPEYRDFWVGEHNESLNKIFRPDRKRTFLTAELDTKLHELEDRYAKKIK